MENAQDLCAGIKRRLENLQEHSLVQLKNCKGPLDLHNDLVQEARQDIHIVEATLEELALLAEDEPTTSKSRQRILDEYNILAGQTSKAKIHLREATLASKRNIQSANTIAQREALFSSSASSSASSKPSLEVSHGSKDDELMSATAGVTDGLRRTRQLLEQELERSSLSSHMLERSSQTLTLTTDQYTSFSGLLQTSKNLINMMQKADTLDRLLILAALAFFTLVCILIIKRRILDRGIRAATLLSRVAGKAIPVGSSSFTAAASIVSQPTSSASKAIASVVPAAASATSIVVNSRLASDVTSISLSTSSNRLSTSVQSATTPTTKSTYDTIIPLSTSTTSLAALLDTTAAVSTSGVEDQFIQEQLEASSYVLVPKSESTDRANHSPISGRSTPSLSTKDTADTVSHEGAADLRSSEEERISTTGTSIAVSRDEL